MRLLFITIRNLSIIVSLLLLFNCQSIVKRNNISNIISNLPDSTIKKLELWRNDSLGCLKYRNSDISTNLYFELNIKSLVKNDIIELLGKPFQITFTESALEYDEHGGSNKLVKAEILEYIVNSFCDNKGNINIESSHIIFSIIINIETGKVIGFNHLNVL